jgi:hypothetical protein
MERRDLDTEPEDDGLWSEAIWSAGLIGSVLILIALLAQFA